MKTPYSYNYNNRDSKIVFGSETFLLYSVGGGEHAAAGGDFAGESRELLFEGVHVALGGVELPSACYHLLLVGG